MDRKIVKTQGYSLAIISFIGGLALMGGDTTLTSSINARMLSIPNYLAIMCIFATMVIKYKCIKPNYSLILVVLFYWFIRTFHTYQGYAPSFRFFSLISMLTFCCIPRESLLEAFKIYRFFLVIMTVLGIISYLSFIFSLGLPYLIDPYYAHDGLTGYYYINYKWAYIVVSGSGPRLCGLFNEPGLFGTILALVLVAGNFNLKKTENVLYLIGGFFSYSLAFYIIIFLYSAIKIAQNPRLIKPAITVAIVVMLIVPILVRHNETLDYLLGRMEFSDGALAGDNRTRESFDILYKQMFETGNQWLGYGNGYTAFHDTGGLSYKKNIIQYGIIGMFLLWGGLLVQALKECRWNRACIIFVICFFASIYQRPNVIDVNYFLILFGGLAYIKYADCTDKDESAVNGGCSVETL